MACIFCEIIEGKKESHTIYEDSNFVAILDRYPIDNGHSLLMPKKHFEKIIDMDETSVGELFSKLPKIANGIIKGTGADAFSIAQNNGKAAKQIIPHVHIHIIPRYNDKATMWTKREIASDSELSVLAKKIRESII